MKNHDINFDTHVKIPPKSERQVKLKLVKGGSKQMEDPLEGYRSFPERNLYNALRTTGESLDDLEHIFILIVNYLDQCQSTIIEKISLKELKAIFDEPYIMRIVAFSKKYVYVPGEESGSTFMRSVPRYPEFVNENVFKGW